MQSLRALLTGIIDYAGLFPPAKLEMGSAVRRYAEHRAGAQAWMLGRFVVPAARLDEFEAEARGVLPGREESPWQLSALAGEEPAAAVENIVTHGAGSGGADGVKISSVEMKAARVDEIEHALHVVPDDLEPYFELPVSEDPTPLIEALAGTRGRAKIRTGGITAEAFPTPQQLARFVAACARAAVPFKATAGLHHAVRGLYRLTYEENSASGTMFGFLNLFLAAAFAVTRGSDETALLPLLEENDAAAFGFDADGAAWRGERLSLAELERARRSFVLSYGSCSFTEPVEELQALGLLPPSSSRNAE
jgi:hypothetical protein